MILQFIYFELLTRCYRFGQCSNILPLQKKSNIFANRVSTEFNAFTTLYFTRESKNNKLITELSQNFDLFAGFFNRELVSRLLSGTLICQK